MQTYNKKMLSNGVIYLLSSIITQLINLFLIPIYTRNLTQAQYGQYNIINALLQLLSIGITLGIYSAMCRFFNEYEEKEDLKNTALTISILWGGVCLLLMYFITPNISQYIFKSDYNANKYIYYITMISMFSSIISIYGCYYSMQFKAIQASIINILVILFTFSLALYSVAYLQREIIGVLEAQFYSRIIIVILLFVTDIKTFRFKLDIDMLKNMLKYSVGLMPGAISAWVLTLIDRYFLKSMINLETVGLYSMGYKIGMLINVLYIRPFVKVFTPLKFYVYKLKDGKNKIRDYFEFYIFFGWFSILGLSLFAKFAIRILSTNQYISIFILVPLIAFSYYLWGLGAFYTLGLHIHKKMIINSLVVIIATVINVVANIILIPIIGMYGAALSTITAYVVASILYFLCDKKYYNIGFSIFHPFKFGLIFIAIYSVYLFITSNINNVFLEFFINIILCSSYIFISLKFSLISKDKVRKIISITRRKINQSEGLSRLFEIVEKIIRILKNEGIIGVYKRVKNKMITISYGYELNLNRVSLAKQQYIIKRMSLKILDEMYRVYSDEISISKYDILKNRIKSIDHEVGYVVINNNGEICGYYHMSYKNTLDTTINFDVRVNDGAVYLFDSYTFTRYRGKGAHKYSINKRLLIAIEKGYKKAILNVVSGNIISEKAVSRFGFKKYIIYKYYHIKRYKKTVSREI